MNDIDSLQKLVDYLMLVGRDTAQVEVKESVGKLSRSIMQTLSAFANGSGGIIILGLSEKDGFQPAKGFDAQRAADALSDMCSNKLTPALRPLIEIVPINGGNVVVAEIDEIAPHDKPCYVTERGMYKGGFIRVADSDRRLTYYEIDRLLEERTQPRHDFELVREAGMLHLDQNLVGAFLSRQREIHPRVFGTLNDEDALRSLKVIAVDENGNDHPTLAGLLALGSFPQEFYPRLTVYFTSYMGTEKVTDGRIKYLDALSAVGSVPQVMESVLHAIRKNMKSQGVLEGLYRNEVPEYPEGALREALCNAVMHRDYSPIARGTQVFVDMYADRIEFINPGGLYGGVTVDTLDEPGVSSTRNQQLSRLLEMTPYPEGGYVAENRGTGFRLIQEQLRVAGLPPAEVYDSITTFRLVFHNKNVNSMTGNEIPDGRSGSLDDVIGFIRDKGEASRVDLERAFGLTRSTAQNRLSRLLETEEIERTSARTSKHQSYRIKQ